MHLYIAFYIMKILRNIYVKQKSLKKIKVQIEMTING